MGNPAKYTISPEILQRLHLLVGAVPELGSAFERADRTEIMPTIPAPSNEIQ